MAYLYVKAIHIVFVVSWMAGLFYIVRLFIYHTEANEKPEGERHILQKQFIIMESRLWNIITTPAMLLTVAAGIAMFFLNPALLQAGWMHVKLAFVAGLLVYHFTCARILRGLKKGVFKYTSTQLRLWNEVATLLLVAIVFTVVVKSVTHWLYGVAAFVALGLILMLAVKMYKKRRLKQK